MSNKNNAAAFVFKRVTITLEDGKNKGKSFQIKDIINGFTYYEDITRPFLSANLNINDSGQEDHSHTKLYLLVSLLNSNN